MNSSFVRQSHAPKNWWKKEFGSSYYTLYNPVLNPQRTKQEVSFIIRATGLARPTRILDVGCGHGRHAIGLAKMGHDVIGIDYSTYFLKIARTEAKKQQATATFIRQDIRSMNFSDEFDVALSMYSAFGYFSLRENLTVLRRIHSALKPGGKFLLDVINAECHVKHITSAGKKVKKGIYQFSQNNEINGYSVQDTNIYFTKTQLDSYHRRWRKGTKTGSYNYYMYQYTVPQYRDMLRLTGFEMLNIWGDYQGARWSPSSWRTIILCYKPRSGVFDKNKIAQWIQLRLLRRWPD